jgi:ribosome-associated protein
MINITQTIFIDEKDISFQFIRSGGPGGQNVNKVSTGVELRFDVSGETSLPSDVKSRLLSLFKNRISKEGILVITAKEFRTQEKNRDAAMERLATIIKQAAVKPRLRKKTKPSKSSQEKRLTVKKRQSFNKTIRRKMTKED